MKMHVGLFAAVGFFIQSTMFGQDRDEDTWIPPELESQLEESAEQEDEKCIAMDVEESAPGRVNFNEASFDQLCRLPALTPLMARRILDARDKLGLLTEQSVRGVEGMDDLLWGRLAPFADFAEPESVSSRPAVMFRSRSRVVRDLQRRQGFRTGVYPGSREHLFQSVTMKFGETSAGVVADRDPGEVTGDGFAGVFAGTTLPSAGIDVLLGDFVASAGEGLALSYGQSIFSFDRSSLRPAKDLVTIRPHRGAEESRFLRGIALEYRRGVITSAFWYSHRNLSGSVENDSVKSVYTAGLFRTASERMKRNAVTETALGTTATVLLGSVGSIGLLYAHSAWSREVAASSGPYASCGRSSDVASAFWNIREGAFLCSGEVARGISKVLASSVRWSYAPISIAELRGSIDWIGNDFRSPSSVLSSSSTPEQGGRMRIGGDILVRPLRNLLLTVQSDQTTWNPDNSLPYLEQSTEGGLEMHVTPAQSIAAHYRLRSSSSPSQIVRDNVSFILTQRRGSKLTVRERADLSRSTSGGTKARGSVFSTEISVALPFRMITLTGRFSLYDVEAYDCRIAALERDVPGGFSSPVLTGRGVRWYLLGLIEPVAGLTVHIKYAATEKDGVTAIGSGNDTITGDLDNRLTLQLDADF